MRLREVFTVRPFALEEIRHRVQPETVQADVEPITEHVDHRVGHFGVLEIEVGLVREKAVPVVLAPLRVPCPVGFFGVDENNPGIAVAMVVVAPHVPVGLGVGAVLAGLLEPDVLVAGVVDDQVGDHPDAAPVSLVDELGDIGDLAVLRQHRPVVGDVVAAVAQWRLVEGEQPDAVHPQPAEVIELAHDPRYVPTAVVVAVEKASYQHLVKNRSLVPANVLARCPRNRSLRRVRPLYCHFRAALARRAREPLAAKVRT